jgi:hypothetical protein
LGIRSAFKEDLQTSSAELVFGEPLRLPGEFFSPSSKGTTDVTDFSARLRSIVQNLQPVPTSWHGRKKSFVFKDLATASYVFLRDDTVRGSLQAAYTGPYLILKKEQKVYKISVNGKPVSVSIDRLKPAYILTESDTNNDVSSHNIGTGTSTEEQERRIKSGRRARFPNRYRLEGE